MHIPISISILFTDVIIFVSFFALSYPRECVITTNAWYRTPLLYFGGRENYPYDEMRQTVHAIRASRYTALHHNWKFLTFPKYKNEHNAS